MYLVQRWKEKRKKIQPRGKKETKNAKLPRERAGAKQESKSKSEISLKRLKRISGR